ncbi:hypothetical protein H5U98_06800 [Mycolicibacterium boenickei]|uniref:Uncharacterized protein n=1 Tax=Mycolicibacterium boenickei TaxID=146017 RepID=A0AAX3A0Z8_9MYCO|nr:hypothetical protein [Mycolicibacterium boenickei]PEG57659.1 hypothetical protein CQY21_26500 [Mycolicibacterium boenickei]UNC01096.1 hypothetical protein H5U98_06800 [Mycolicibacterium boenickei]BBX90940.1 hypothetical protein MBOE_25890 [Mycolicibacterium boenickei]
MSFEQDTQHRINQTLAKAGVAVVMPDDWDYVTKLADGLGQNDFVQLTWLDQDSDATALAAEKIMNHLATVGIGFPEYGIQPNPHGHTEIAEHRGPQYDPADPMTQNRLYGLLAGLPGQLIPLSSEYTWKDVVNERLPHYHKCDIGISRDCMADNAVIRFPVKLGEIVVIFASCQQCRKWFDLDGFDRRLNQRRPINTQRHHDRLLDMMHDALPSADNELDC